MTDPQLFILADTYLDSVVQQISDDKWTLAIPEWVPLSSNVVRSELNLQVLINYHAYDDIWVPDMLAGKTMAEVGEEKWKNEDLLGTGPKVRFSSIVETAVVAAGSVTEAQLDNTAHLSFGDYTIRDYFAQITQFRALRAYEFAKMIGVDITIPTELVQGLMYQLSPHIEAWRSMGVFGPKVALPDNASAQDKLLALTGRDPRSV